MEEEMSQIEKNEIWELVPRPKDKPVIPQLWVYRIKLDSKGIIEEYKARSTAKGCRQKLGVDFFDTYAPTLKYKSMRILMSLVAGWDYELGQMDVSTAFLNAELKEEVYTEQPEGFKENDLVWLLVKSLYGIHQAPREWYLLVSEFVKQSLGFKSCVTDPCFFFKTSKSGKLILLIMFVDDFQIGYHHSDESEWMKLKELFCDRFKTKYTEVSQCTSPATSMPLRSPTTCWPHYSTTTSTTATSLASTCGASPGSALWT